MGPSCGGVRWGVHPAEGASDITEKILSVLQGALEWRACWGPEESEVERRSRDGKMT